MPLYRTELPDVQALDYEETKFCPKNDQFAADGHLRLVLAALNVEYGSTVVLDGETDTVIFKDRDSESTVARVEVIGRV